MINVSGRDIITKAMAMEEGEEITIPCSSYKEMETLRSQLYKRKKVLERSYKGIADSLFISREIKEGKFAIFIIKEKSVNEIFITDKDGNIRPFERVEADTFGDENEEERMVKLMKEDGMTEGAIADLLAERGEEDFDKAASKIEALQDSQSEDKADKKVKKRQ